MSWKIKLVILLFIPSLGMAAIYKYVNPQGGITYTDRHHSGATKVDLPKLNVVSQPDVAIPKAVDDLTPTTAEPAKPPAPVIAKQNYTQLDILRPENKETIYNQPNILVEVQVAPELASGDKIVLFLDKATAPYYLGTKTKIDLHNIDRGEHTLLVQIIDEQGKVLISSQEITIYVKYSTVFQREKLSPAPSPLRPVPTPIRPTPTPIPPIRR